MGSMLFLIITFNLALAHHLKVLKKAKTKKMLSSTKPLIESTVRLYKLLLDVANHNTNTASTDKNQRFNKIVRNNLTHLNNIENNVEKDEASKKKTTMKLVLEKPSPSSLYEQHKELLRNRYALSSSSSMTMKSTSSSLSSSSSSSSSSLNNSLKYTDENGFSLRLQNAIRTSSSFMHLQQKKNINTAFAA